MLLYIHLFIEIRCARATSVQEVCSYDYIQYLHPNCTCVRNVRWVRSPGLLPINFNIMLKIAGQRHGLYGITSKRPRCNMSNRMVVQLDMKVFTKGEYNRQRIRNSRNIWLQPKRNLSARLAARTSMRGRIVTFSMLLCIYRYAFSGFSDIRLKAILVNRSLAHPDQWLSNSYTSNSKCGDPFLNKYF